MKKLAVICLGSFVTSGGLVVFISPIPFGFAVVVLGLMILATKVAWARNTLDWLQEHTGPAGRKLAQVEDKANQWFVAVGRWFSLH